MKALYTAVATATDGGRNGHTRTDDGKVDFELSMPESLGGPGGEGTNPEQLFAAGYAACFEGALGVAARRDRLEVGDVAIDSSVSLLPTEERTFRLGVELHVTLPSVPDSDQAVALVRAAHRICPYSNATRGNIGVALTANGAPVAAE